MLTGNRRRRGAGSAGTPGRRILRAERGHDGAVLQLGLVRIALHGFDTVPAAGARDGHAVDPPARQFGGHRPPRAVARQAVDAGGPAGRGDAPGDLVVAERHDPIGPPHGADGGPVFAEGAGEGADDGAQVLLRAIGVALRAPHADPDQAGAPVVDVAPGQRGDLRPAQHRAVGEGEDHAVQPPAFGRRARRLDAAAVAAGPAGGVHHGDGVFVREGRRLLRRAPRVGRLLPGDARDRLGDHGVGGRDWQAGRAVEGGDGRGGDLDGGDPAGRAHLGQVGGGGLRRGGRRIHAPFRTPGDEAPPLHAVGRDGVRGAAGPAGAGHAIRVEAAEAPGRIGRHGPGDHVQHSELSGVSRALTSVKSDRRIDHRHRP